jgi:hypothetical protein
MKQPLSRRWSARFLPSLALLAAACDTESPEPLQLDPVQGGCWYGLDIRHELVVADSENQYLPDGWSYTINTRSVEHGQTTAFPLEVSNRSWGSTCLSPGLHISSITLEEEVFNNNEALAPSFRCFVPSQNNIDCSKAEIPILVGGTNPKKVSRFPFVVEFLHTPGPYPRVARLKIHAPNNGYGQKVFDVQFVALDGVPSLDIKPGPVNFGRVPAGAARSQTVPMSNVGDADLTVSRIDALSLDPARFRLSIAGHTILGGQAKNFDPPVLIAPRQTLELDATYQAEDQLPVVGEVFLTTNDPWYNWRAQHPTRLVFQVNSPTPSEWE